MTAKKRIVLVVATAMVSILAVAAIVVCQAIHIFEVEDQIHDAYFPVVKALGTYEDDHHSPATNLSQLVPDYISKIPSCRAVDSVEYSTIDGGKAWQLTLHSRALSEPRIYCFRSNHKFSSNENERVVRAYHVWTVLKE